MNVRPTLESDERSAYCVAVKRILHSCAMKATKAAVPMPPVIFSMRIHAVRAEVWAPM